MLRPRNGLESEMYSVAPVTTYLSQDPFSSLQAICCDVFERWFADRRQKCASKELDNEQALGVTPLQFIEEFIVVYEFAALCLF